MTAYFPTAPPAPPRRSRKGLVIALVVMGSVLLLAIALIALLLVRGTAAATSPATATGSVVSAPTSAATSAVTSPTASATPSASTASNQTATATVAATRTAVTATGPQVATFSVVPQSSISGATVTCTKAVNLRVDFRWTTTGATGVFFGVMTSDAQQAPYLSNLPANGSLGSGQAVVFPCYADAGAHTQSYTLTVTSSGQKVSRTIILKEKYVP